MTVSVLTMWQSKFPPTPTLVGIPREYPSEYPQEYPRGCPGVSNPVYLTTWGNFPGNTLGIPPRKPYLRDQGVKQSVQGVYVVQNDRLSNLQPRRRLNATVARIRKIGLCRDIPSAGNTPFLIPYEGCKVYATTGTYCRERCERDGCEKVVHS
jgi:hypothetical protein